MIYFVAGFPFLSTGKQPNAEKFLGVDRTKCLFSYSVDAGMVTAVPGGDLTLVSISTPRNAVIFSPSAIRANSVLSFLLVDKLPK